MVKKTTVKEICIKTFASSHSGIRSIEKTEAMTYDDRFDSNTMACKSAVISKAEYNLKNYEDCTKGESKNVFIIYS